MDEIYCNDEVDRAVGQRPSTSQKAVGDGLKSSRNRAVVWILGLLSSLLLAGIIILGVFYYSDTKVLSNDNGSSIMKTLVFPSETANSYVEMVPLKPLDLRAFTLCMRIATELPRDREIILFAYRTTDYDELNVWQELDGKLSFYLAGDGVKFTVPELGPLQTHLCFTWDSSSGAAALFINGEKTGTKVYRRGHAVRSLGTVIVGQDPDSYPVSSFEADQSFVGEIFDINMWDHVLSHSTISAVASWERVERGNVFDWESVELKRHGSVELLESEL